MCIFFNTYLNPTRVKDDFVSDDVLKLAMGLYELIRVLTDDKILKLKEAVRVGIESEIPLMNYNEFCLHRHVYFMLHILNHLHVTSALYSNRESPTNIHVEFP